MARRMSVHGDFLKEGDLQCKGGFFMWYNRHYMLMEDGALHQLKCKLTASSAAIPRGDLELSVTNCAMVDPEETSFVLKAKTPEERDQWILSFTNAIEHVKQRAAGATAGATAAAAAPNRLSEPLFFGAPSSVSLENASIEELTEALQKKGVLATPPPQVDTRGIAMATKAVLESIGAFVRQDSHKQDVRRQFTRNAARYMSFTTEDWERKPPGHCNDAVYRIVIGPTEDLENTPMVLIKFFDTTQKLGPRGSTRMDEVEPIYGIAFTAQEMRDLTANVVANAETLGTLIHREPQGDIEPDEPAYMEVHWLVEGGKLTGIRAVIKATQDSAPTMQLLRWKMRGDRFEIVSECEVILPPKPKASRDGFEVVLPEPSFEGVAVEYGKGQYMLQQVQPTLKFDSAGESDIQLSYATSSEWDIKQATYGWSRFRGGSHWIDDGFLRQRVTSPLITLMNPTDSDTQIAEYWVEVCMDGQFVRAKSSHVGMSGWNGDVDWITDGASTVPLEKHVGFDVYFRGMLEVTATEDASNSLCEHIDAADSGGAWYQAFIIARSDASIRVHFNGWASQYDEDIPTADIATRTRPRSADTPTGGSGNETDEAVRIGASSKSIKWNMMPLEDSRCLHPYFGQPLRCRLVVKDDSGKTRSIDWEICNEVMEHFWTDFSSAQKAMGPDCSEFHTHRADLFMCYENPITFSKVVISVTSEVEKPDKYVVRMSNDTRKITGSSSYCYPESLRRIGYNAKKEGKKEVDPEFGNIVPSDSSKGSCTLTALVDDKGGVYALRGDISITHNGKTLLKASRHMAIDYDRFST